MRERYWNFYYKITYQFYYYKRFMILFNRINWIITCFCGLTALSCVAAWGIWKTHPVVWSCLICLAQLVQALCPRLPYNDLLVSTKFMISSLERLRLEVDHKWLEIDLYDYDDNKIFDLVEKYEALYNDLVQQFYSGTYLPEIRYCEKKAEDECACHFQMYISK